MMVVSKIKRLKYACYFSSFSMSVVGNLSPVLFLIFHSLYGISYSLLGFLVLINFVTQLGIDLIFSFFSHKFNISKVVKTMPLITITGLVIYAASPFIFKNFVYLGLAVGTLIFSAAAGLAEVLISPIIAAIPSKNPDREMSKLHSVYAWGVVFVIIFSTVFLLLFGSKSWPVLALCFCLIPVTAALLFGGVEIPLLKTDDNSGQTSKLLKNKLLWCSVLAIFCGGAAECAMAQWSSGYLEGALGIPKVWGDIFGVAMFSVMLGLGRTLYAKFGKNIAKVLTLSGIGAVICYVVAAITSVPLVGLIACAFTGFCTAMLWPGNLIVVENRFPKAGVFIYAMMAAGGDLGASIAPQLIGVITDLTELSQTANAFAANLGITASQLGMKIGLLVGAIFPLIGIIFYAGFLKDRIKNKD